MSVVTLTSSNTNYDLATLLLAVSATERIHCNSLTISAPLTNTVDVLVGDPTVSATNWGWRIPPGEAVTIDSSSGCNSVNVNQFTVRGDGAATQKLSLTQVIS